MSTIALVTGASQGIGAAIALRLASEPGYKLALVARDRGKLEVVAEQCRALGAETHVFACDLTQEAQVQAMAKTVARELGTLDLLVNNAGRFVRADLLAMDHAAFQSVLDVNLSSAFLVTRSFIGAMLAKGRGTIFFMGSVASLQAFPESGAYCVSKHALLGLARSFRSCTAGTGLRITTIMPGATESPSWNAQELAGNRMMPAKDVAEALINIYQLSGHSVVEEIILRPTSRLVADSGH